MHRRALALVASCSLVACGGGSSDPDAGPPATIPMGDLGSGFTGEVILDPLTLIVRDPDGEVVLSKERFVEVGVVDTVDPAVYYDPAAPQGEVTFLVPERATAWDAADSALTLPIDDTRAVILQVEPNAPLELRADPGSNVVLLRFVLPLGLAEEVYGFGGVEDSPASRGVIREMQLRIDLESDSSTNEVHVPVPLALYPSREVGLFVPDHRPGAFDVGLDRADSMLVTFATPALRMHVYGGRPIDVLSRYAAQVGRPKAPPEWAFAPMQWRNVHEDAAQVIEDAQAIRDHDLPGSTIWIDNPWQTGYNTFTFDPDRFPDPAGLVADLEARGFKTVVWSTPYVNRDGPTATDHDEAAEMQYLVTDDLGRPFDWPWQDGPGALVDFTREGAQAWWQERIRRVTDLGVVGFKLDFGEDLVPELGLNKTPFLLAGGDTQWYHNVYAQDYHETYLAVVPDGFLITRAGAWGTQSATTCVWPGDLDNDFGRRTPLTPGGLPAAIAVGLSLSSSGFPFYASDIGGFRGGVPTAEVLIRWAEYAALAGPVMQLGGGGGGGESHNPWDTATYGPLALDIYRRYARLHTDLFPYWAKLARDAASFGRPIAYPPGLVHPGHPYEDAFYVGDGLFVAPVVSEGATMRRVTLPPGEWFDWWTGEQLTGGVAVEVPAPLDVLPMWRKHGAIIPMLLQPVDTFIPAQDPSIVSLADPDVARELRVVVTPVLGTSRFELADEGEISVLGASTEITLSATFGSRHTIYRYEIDWEHGPASAVTPTTSDVPLVADDDALATCPAPGCWRWDDAGRRAVVRLIGSTSQVTIVSVR